MEQEIIEQTKQEAQSLLQQGKISEALPLIRQAAHWGDLDSQKQAMDYYLHGAAGMPFNPLAGIEYARMAALNGDVVGMYDLAHLLSNGQGCQKDEQGAYYFMNKAARAGFEPAMDPLGMMLLKGKGCSKDVSQALEWIKKASAAFPEDEGIARHLKLASALQAKLQALD